MKPNEKCQPLINQVLELAISTSSVETVILAGRAVTEINEKSFINTKSWFLLKQNQKNIDPYLLFQTSMKKTLRRLINARKNVIFVLDTPDLEFLPASCLNRPWRMTGQKIKNPCAISRIKVDERRQKYINLVTKVLDEFPTVKVWDTLPAFCDSEYCWATKDGKILYRDENHLNEAGAVYLGKYLQGKEL